jgi:hypothetical protein
MLVTTRSAKILSSRFAQVFALSGVIAMAACQDATAPEEIKPAQAPAELRMTQGAAQDELSSLASNLDDATGWSLIALTDDVKKGKIVGLLNGLKGQLASGKIAACQQSVTDARSWFASLTEQEQTEVGAVGVALDLIQSTLDKASQ